jgi:hypothetical protein
LILAELTAALGHEEADRVLSAVRSVTEQGLAVLLVSHRFDELTRPRFEIPGPKINDPIFAAPSSLRFQGRLHGLFDWLNGCRILLANSAQSLETRDASWR